MKKFGKPNITKRTIQCTVIIIGVIIIPLLYSYFYLGAFWDPYSRLETLPVAIVNQDKGATINGEERNLGDEVCDSLKEDGTLDFIFTSEEDAKKGTEGDDYYAMIVVPEDFSSNIASSGTTDKQTGTIVYSPNEKRNYLASQILSRAVIQIEESVRSNINKEITQELVDNLNSVPDKMGELQDGAQKLADGTSSLYDGTQQLASGTTKLDAGASTLANGTKEYTSKFQEYEHGVATLANGANSVATGATSLNDGLKKLSDGANQLVASTQNVDTMTTGTQQLAAGTDSLAKGAGTLNAGLTQYTTGVGTVAGYSKSASAAISAAFASDPNLANNSDLVTAYGILTNPTYLGTLDTLTGSSATLTASTGQLEGAAKQLSAGASQLSAGAASLPQLKAALLQMQSGLTTAQNGSAQLANGSQSLYVGALKLQDASTQLGNAADSIATGAASLKTGTSTLAGGVSKLEDGASELKDGTGTLKDGVDSSITDTTQELKKLDGLSEYAEAPVTVEQDNITAVPNYGTAFAPYFLSLSLWVGGLIIFITVYFDPSSKFKTLSSTSDKKLARSFIYLLIGFTQAILLGIILKYMLGLEVANTGLYYVSCCLVSLVFIAIIQFLMVFLKDLGKFLSMLLLILQLTSCGGTFPMETLPKFFNVIYPFMPMTYSVGLFKQTISGIDSKEFAYNAGVLGAMLVVFMVLTVLCSVIRLKHEDGTESENLLVQKAKAAL